jgi:hypothetical protein
MALDRGLEEETRDRPDVLVPAVGLLVPLVPELQDLEIRAFHADRRMSC